MSAPPRILVADRHRLFGEGLACLLEQGGYRAACACSLDEGRAMLQAEGPFHLALLDYRLPGVEGLSGLRRLLQAERPCPVALLVPAVDRTLAQTALELGAAGIVLKTDGREVLFRGLRRMLAGERHLPPRLAPATPSSIVALTRREGEVYALLASGLSNKQIARQLGIGPATVAMHLTAIFRKLGVTSRTEAIAGPLGAASADPGLTATGPTAGA